MDNLSFGTDEVGLVDMSGAGTNGVGAHGKSKAAHNPDKVSDTQTHTHTQREREREYLPLHL